MRTVEQLREEYTNSKHNFASYIDDLIKINVEEAKLFLESLTEKEYDAYFEQRFNEANSNGEKSPMKMYILGDNPSEEAIKALFDDDYYD